MKIKNTITTSLILLLLSCGEEEPETGLNDNTGPTIFFTSPDNNSIVSDTVYITCESADASGVYKVELWINNDSTNIADETEPYILSWATNDYQNGQYTLFIRSYDIAGNKSKSDNRIIIVNNFTTFGKTFGEPFINETGYSILQNSDSSIIVLGGTENNNYDLTLLKTDREGLIIWENTFGGSGFDIAYNLEKTTDSGYLISGTTESYGQGESDCWLIKTDYLGTIVWNKTYGTAGLENGGQSIEIDEGYLFIGDTYNPEDQNQNIFLIRANSLGDTLWTKQFGDRETDYGSDIVSTVDGGYMILGSTKQFSILNFDIWMIKIDTDGTEQWNKHHGSGSDDYGQTILYLSDGTYLIKAISSAFGNENSSVILLKTDASGNEEWTKSFGGTNSNPGNTIQETGDGSFIMVNSKYDYGNNDYDIWLIKIDKNGLVEWEKTFGGINSDLGLSVDLAVDGGYILTGSTSTLGNGDENSSDLWLIKTDSEGNTIAESE